MILLISHDKTTNYDIVVIKVNIEISDCIIESQWRSI